MKLKTLAIIIAATFMLNSTQTSASAQLACPTNVKDFTFTLAKDQDGNSRGFYWVGTPNLCWKGSSTEGIPLAVLQGAPLEMGIYNVDYDLKITCTYGGTMTPGGGTMGAVLFTTQNVCGGEPPLPVAYWIPNNAKFGGGGYGHGVYCIASNCSLTSK